MDVRPSSPDIAPVEHSGQNTKASDMSVSHAHRSLSPTGNAPTGTGHFPSGAPVLKPVEVDSSRADATPIVSMPTPAHVSTEEIAAHVAKVGKSIVDAIHSKESQIWQRDRNTTAILLTMQRCCVDLGISGDPRNERFMDDITTVANSLANLSGGRVSARKFLGTLNGIREAFALLDGQPKDSPLSCIAKEHRWRLCIDPAHVDTLCAMHAACGIPASSHVPQLYALSYNSGDSLLDGDFSKGEPGGYFQSMAKSWDHVMRNRHKPMDVTWWCETHAAGCRPIHSKPGDMFVDQINPRRLDDLNEAALEEILALKKEIIEIRKEIPALPPFYYDQFEKTIYRGNVGFSATEHLTNATEEETAQALQEPLKQLAQRWINKCQERLDDCDSLEDKQKEVDKHAKKCLRYHFFEDGNARLFIFAMLNHYNMALVRALSPNATPLDEAKALTIIYDLYKMDCCPADRFAQMRRDGQRLVQSWIVQG
jgi:hypothetical protein